MGRGGGIRAQTTCRSTCPQPDGRQSHSTAALPLPCSPLPPQRGCSTPALPAAHQVRSPDRGSTAMPSSSLSEPSRGQPMVAGSVNRPPVGPLHAPSDNQQPDRSRRPCRERALADPAEAWEHWRCKIDLCPHMRGMSAQQAACRRHVQCAGRHATSRKTFCGLTSIAGLPCLRLDRSWMQRRRRHKQMGEGECANASRTDFAVLRNNIRHSGTQKRPQGVKRDARNRVRCPRRARVAWFVKYKALLSENALE